jgi:hypothetical protein
MRWHSSLLSDATTIQGGAYITLHPTKAIFEADLRPTDSEIMVHLSAVFGQGHDVFMPLLDQALSRAWNGAFVSCRHGCELRNQNQRPTAIGP